MKIQRGGAEAQRRFYADAGGCTRSTRMGLRLTTAASIRLVSWSFICALRAL